MSALEELDGDALGEVLAGESRGVLVDFWSPWCAPCRVLRPHLDRLGEERRDAWRFAAVNAEAEPALAERFGVRSLPTLILFRAGEEVHRFSGTTLIGTVAEKLDELG